MKVITVLSILLLLSACQKERIKLLDSQENLVGNYEWYHSYSNTTNESESYQSISDQHGIRIKKNGKLEFYTNGELVQKGFVFGTQDSLLFIEFNEMRKSMTFSGDDFSLNDFPIEGHANQFRKHE